MATANIIELTTCMKDCLAYCEEHSDKDYVEYHYPRLQDANQKFYESIQTSDQYYRTFAQASIADKKAWKAASSKIRAIQTNLERFEANGYPTNIVLYWDIPLFRGHAQQMLKWLDSAEEIYRYAKDDAAELRRLCHAAEQARVDRDDALDAYAQQAQLKAGAMGTMAIYLTEFRSTLRRHIGKEDPGYLAIHWPFSLSPDRPVLI